MTDLNAGQPDSPEAPGTPNTATYYEYSSLLKPGFEDGAQPRTVFITGLVHKNTGSGIEQSSTADSEVYQIAATPKEDVVAAMSGTRIIEKERSKIIFTKVGEIAITENAPKSIRDFTTAKIAQLMERLQDGRMNNRAASNEIIFMFADAATIVDRQSGKDSGQ